MKLQDHIAYRFLTDESLIFEALGSICPKEMNGALSINALDELPEEISSPLISLYDLLSYEKQKTYIITKSVIEDKLEMLKIDKCDWSLFKSLKECKDTLILPDTKDNLNRILRVKIYDDVIRFCFLTFKKDNVKKNYGHINWCIFYVNRITGEKCDHFEHKDVKTIETLLYKLMCFMYLTKNEEIIVKPKSKYGTLKAGKVINPLDIPVIIVNSYWNTTLIRNEKFDVRGHFAIRWSGINRSIPKLVFIEPFEKQGYVRKSIKDNL